MDKLYYQKPQNLKQERYIKTQLKETGKPMLANECCGWPWSWMSIYWWMLRCRGNNKGFFFFIFFYFEAERIEIIEGECNFCSFMGNRFFLGWLILIIFFLYFLHLLFCIYIFFSLKESFALFTSIFYKIRSFCDFFSSYFYHSI